MTPDQADRPDRQSGFDPRRSSEIRSLLTDVVAGAPKPRTARLSRAMFSLAATVALLFAGGIGAGTVVAYQQLSVSVDAQTPVTSEPPASEAEAVEAGFPASAVVSDLVPVLMVEGEVGYAHRATLEVTAASAQSFLSKSASADSDTSGARVPIYRADGVTVVGYYDPAALISPTNDPSRVP